MGRKGVAFKLLWLTCSKPLLFVWPLLLSHSPGFQGTMTGLWCAAGCGIPGRFGKTGYPIPRSVAWRNWAHHEIHQGITFSGWVGVIWHQLRGLNPSFPQVVHTRNLQTDSLLDVYCTRMMCFLIYIYSYAYMYLYCIVLPPFRHLRNSSFSSLLTWWLVGPAYSSNYSLLCGLLMTGP